MFSFKIVIQLDMNLTGLALSITLFFPVLGVCLMLMGKTFSELLFCCYLKLSYV